MAGTERSQQTVPTLVASCMRQALCPGAGLIRGSGWERGRHSWLKALLWKQVLSTSRAAEAAELENPGWGERGTQK